MISEPNDPTGTVVIKDSVSMNETGTMLEKEFDQEEGYDDAVSRFVFIILILLNSVSMVLRT